MLSHAPQGACELKYGMGNIGLPPMPRHAPQGACELKLSPDWIQENKSSHAPQGACELK